MSSDPARFADWLALMIRDIDEITSFIGDENPTEAMEDRRTRLAVERLLGRISEAVSRFRRADIPLAELEPGVPWRRIHDFGNIVRHDYDSLEADLVIEIVSDHLNALRTAAVRLKARFEDEPTPSSL